MEFAVLIITKKLFELGQLLITSGSEEKLNSLQMDPMVLLARHVSGDWREMHEDDQAQNADAVKNGGRIMSEYTLNVDEKIWVITEWNRSVTTILLPEEY